jgi:transcription elongation factor Elf1
MKVCSKCKIEKTLDCFYKEKSKLNGYSSNCKVCKKEYQQSNKEKISQYKKIYSEINKQKLTEYRKQYKKNKLTTDPTYKLKKRIRCLISNSFKRNKNIMSNLLFKGNVNCDNCGTNFKCIKCLKNHFESKENYSKKYYQVNKEKIKKNQKTYYENNKEILNEKSIKYKTLYKLKNIEKIKTRNNNYLNKKRNENPIFKFKQSIRTNINIAFKRGKNQYKKNSRTEVILGCTIEEFVVYIQSQFKKGMTLENHGQWHLDHIIPLASATTEDEIIKLNHYTNFQPLWAKENIIKRDKIIEKQLKLL